MSDGVQVELFHEDEVLRLIESREWWIFVGAHSVYGEIEERFYPHAMEERSFLTVMGPPVGEFRKIDPHCRMMVLHFGRKDKLSAADLAAFFRGHRRSKYFPHADWNQQDIIWILREEL